MDKTLLEQRKQELETELNTIQLDIQLSVNRVKELEISLFKKQGAYSEIEQLLKSSDQNAPSMEQTA